MNAVASKITGIANDQLETVMDSLEKLVDSKKKEATKEEEKKEEPKKTEDAKDDDDDKPDPADVAKENAK